MKKSEALFLLDGYSLIYRSYFAFINRPLTNSEGKNVSAYFGFFRTLLSLFDSYNPRYFAVVMDSRVPTFRHEMYAEYKATREKAPEDLHDQVPMIEETLEAMNIQVVRKDRYEADDIIATLSRQCSEEGRRCYIVSGDKDLLQLVDEHVNMLRPDKGSYRSIGPAQVEEDLGIRPEQIIDYLSLIGDSADNIPGVKGIGPKTASKLLQKFDSLDGIYEHVDQCSKGEQKKLGEGRDSAYLSRELIVLHDVEQFSGDLHVYSLEKLDRGAAVPLFIKEGARSLAEQAQKGVDDSSDSASLSASKTESEEPAARSSRGAGQRPAGQSREGELDLFGTQKNSADSPGSGQAGAASHEQAADTSHLSGKGRYTAIDSISELQEWMEKIRRAGSFAFDIETTSLDEMQADPVGFSIAVASGEAVYVPLIAGGKQILDPEEVREALRPVLEDPELELIGHNFKYDYKVLARWGITARSLQFDTMIAAWLLDSTASSYSMDALAERLLNYRTLHYKDVVPKGELFSSVELKSAVEYAAEDADITYRLYELFSPDIEKGGLHKLFHEIEMPLVRILADMELRGIRLLKKRLEDYSEELSEDLQSIEKAIYEEVGYEFNISSTKQLQEVLFVERKLKPVKKTKTGYSTDLKVLEQLSQEDVVPQMVLKHRGMSKLKSTYVDTLPQLVDETRQRIHTSFSQTGTATGRLSSREPNLQNIPIRDEAGRRIRKAFVPQDGWKLISADYSQIELVVLAHLSGDPQLSETFQSGGDVHSRTASLIFGIDEKEVSSEQRRIAKTINFGVMYGMSGFRLSQELKIPRAKADEFISAYFNRYSAINQFIQETIQKTEASGSVSTMLGHRREIPGINSRNRTEKSGAERIAVNTPIQGTAADIVKLAMLSIDEEIRSSDLPLRMLLQIHDELIFEAPSGEAEKMAGIIKSHMENAVELSVPLKVSVEIGDSWGDFH